MNVRLLLCVFLVSTNGCRAIKKPLTLVPVNQPQAEMPLDSDLDFPAEALGEFVYDNSPEIKAALKEFATSGKAPIVKRAGFVQFPFGEVQPILNCQTNYGCDIELQAGERVKAVILGNEPVWDYLVWESNQQSKPIQHITIGPRISSGRTNAIIGTDRRTYHLELLSTKKSEYIRSAKFYYPRERLREFQARENTKNQIKAKQEQQQARENILREIADSGGLPYERLSFGWKIEAKRNVPWKPKRAFDDGAHIYLQFPNDVIFEDFPGSTHEQVRTSCPSLFGGPYSRKVKTAARKEAT